jgi:hypothetical protein
LRSGRGARCSPGELARQRAAAFASLRPTPMNEPPPTTASTDADAAPARAGQIGEVRHAHGDDEGGGLAPPPATAPPQRSVAAATLPPTQAGLEAALDAAVAAASTSQGSAAVRTCLSPLPALRCTSMPPAFLVGRGTDGERGCHMMMRARVRARVRHGAGRGG